MQSNPALDKAERFFCMIFRAEMRVVAVFLPTHTRSASSVLVARLLYHMNMDRRKTQEFFLLHADEASHSTYYGDDGSADDAIPTSPSGAN